MKILTFPSQFLRSEAQPVPQCNETTRKNLRAMLTMMRQGNGIGLAAPQMGLLERLIVMEIPEKSHPQKQESCKTPLFFVNPSMVSVSRETDVQEEGCLSLPDILINVRRSVSCTVSYWDEKGQQHTTTFHDLEARCIQHEMDHLEGRLLLDHLSPLKRRLMEKKIIKQQKSLSFVA